MKKIHIEGLLKLDDDGLKIDYYLLADLIAEKLDKSEDSKHETDDYNTNSSVYVPKVSLQIYSCEKKCTLEEAQEGFLKRLHGSLDIYTQWYGYSEYTIVGYYTTNFTLGNHDLEKEWSSLTGKYIHILIEVKNKPKY